MRLDERWYRGRLIELSPSECAELLTTRPVGRVAYGDADGPVVLTMNYVLDSGDILFRTAPHSVLARALESGPVAFQVDEFDEYTESGWSVLVRGRAAATYEDPPRHEDRPNTWAGGARTLFVRISTDTVTGRRLLPV